MNAKTDEGLQALHQKLDRRFILSARHCNTASFLILILIDVYLLLSVSSLPAPIPGIMGGHRMVIFVFASLVILLPIGLSVSVGEVRTRVVDAGWFKSRRPNVGE